MKTIQEDVSLRRPNVASASKLSFGVAYCVIAGIAAVLILLILKLNHGTFTYTLDDPYIDLALSSQILHGNYGMIAGHHAAPSSSILFPFLLVAAGTSLFHTILPLMINIAALFLTVEIMRRFLLHLGFACDGTGAVVLGGALVLMSVGLNLVGVVFTGLEHSLHIAAVAAIIYGLVRFLDDRKMPVWLPAVIVVCPLLRYEGLPLSLAAIAVLAIRGRRRTAAITLALVVISVAGFSCFLLKLGLGPLPSSILAKSSVVADGVDGSHHLFGSIANNAAVMLRDPVGMFLLLIGIAALTRSLLETPLRLGRLSSQGLMGVVLFCMVAGHALAGRFGWFFRYEDYVIVGVLLIGIYVFQGSIRKTLMQSGKRRTLLVAAAALCFLVVAARYIKGTALVPIAANNIYEQQFQMHRFVNDYYRGPVAVNDLGLVSYQNPRFVLDLGGLASREALILKAGKPNPAAYDALLRNDKVHLAILYDEWFVGRIPGDWIKVGRMELSRPRVSVDEKDVEFYATDATTAQVVRRELAAFGGTLPDHVKLAVY